MKRVRRILSLPEISASQGALSALCLLVLFVLLASSAAASPGIYKTVKSKADVMVNIQFVLQVKMDGAGADREIEGDVTCLMIDAKGLILCSNTELGGYVGMLGRMMGQGMSLTANPTNVRLVMDDGEEVPATVLTRDSDRDLVWLRLDEMGEKTFPFLDFKNSATLGLGETFYLVRTMDEFFGRSPLVSEGKVGAELTKPRRLWAPAAPIGGGFGTPIFNADGALVGITVLQVPGPEDGAMGQLGSPLSFVGEAARIEDMTNGLILPAAEVEKATRLVLEMAKGEEE